MDPGRDPQGGRQGAAAGDLSAELGALCGYAAEVGAAEIAGDADALAERIREGRFYVAVLGQFKRGKSTLINALLGEALLPVGVAPVTSVVTVVRHGARGARARIDDRDWEPLPVERVAELVSEKANPENRLAVRGVEVMLPSPLLASGMCLVDTPGISSVFAGNTAETRAFVPHVDAAIVVLGADPPISGEELALVEEVAGRVPDVLFVLAKADRYSAADLEEARAFTTGVLCDRLRAEPIIVEVSALEVLERGNATREWDPLLERLRSLAGEHGGDLVQRAAERGTAAIGKRLLADIDEQRRALTSPLEETRARVAAVQGCMADAERALHELGFLLQAEQKGVSERLEAERRRFVAEALPQCQARLEESLGNLEPRRGPKLRAATFSSAQDIVRDEVNAWMQRLRPEVEQMYRALGHRFIAHANQFLARLRRDGRLPEGSLEDLPEEAGFRYRSAYYFFSHMSLATPPLLTWLADVLRPGSAAQRAVRRDGQAFVQRLVETNSSRVVGDLNDRVFESRRQLEFEVRGRLGAVVATAERALAGAEAAERGGQAAIEEALARLDRIRAAVLAAASPSAPAG